MSHGSESRLDGRWPRLAGLPDSDSDSDNNGEMDWRHRLTGGLGDANVAPNKCTGGEL
jgi:hypothetical protein